MHVANPDDFARHTETMKAVTYLIEPTILPTSRYELTTQPFTVSTSIPLVYKLPHLLIFMSLGRIRAIEPSISLQQTHMPKPSLQKPQGIGTEAHPLQEPGVPYRHYPKIPSYDIEALSKMDYTFDVPDTMVKLRSKANEPWALGVAIGMLLCHIPPLVITHLENGVTFQNLVPSALIWAPEFISAVDQYVAYLRRMDGLSEKLPISDRKARREGNKYIERYTYLVEATYKRYIAASLADVFASWGSEQTQMFNKGVDKALGGLQWKIYPQQNVVVEVGKGCWRIWLKERCEALGMERARCGESALEEM
jgi:hypothetical protein